jgi:dTDP-glucose 4,6-dehydratase
VRLSDSSSRVSLIDRTADDPERRRPDLGKARELLGYEPKVGPEEGLARTVAYFAAR